MRIKISAYLAIFLAFSAFSAGAQDYVFKVLANKGANEFKSGDAWEPIKIGTALNANDEIRLGANAYLGLVHKSGKPLEVKEARAYKVSELEGQLGTATSVLQKYTDFILSGEDGPSNRLTATGAVHRDISLQSQQIRVMLPDNNRAGVFNNTVVVRWEAEGLEGPFLVRVRNMFEDVLIQEETSDDNYSIDLNDEIFSNEAALLVEVSVKADANIISQSKLIKRLSPAETEKIASELKQMGETASEPSAMNQYILASFYEQNNLIIDAIGAFEQAVALQPEVAFFKDEYEAFLQRNQLQ